MAASLPIAICVVLAVPMLEAVGAGNREIKPVAQIGGPCNGVDVAGQFAYIGEGPNFTILDISNPASPVKIGGIRLDLVGGISVSDGVACVHNGLNSELVVVDVSNPAQPLVRAHYPVRGMNDVYLTGRHAFVATAQDLRIVDVTDASSPTTTGGFYGRGQSVFVAGQRAYLGMYGLWVLDVSDPNSPTIVSYYDLDSNVRGIHVSNGIACVIGSKLHIVDITDPSSPTLRSRYDIEGSGVHVSNGFAYVAGSYRGLQILDISNPSSPTLVGTYETSGYARNVTVSGGLAYVASGGGGLAIVDVTEPASPTLRGRFLTLGSPTDVAVRNGVAYVSDEAAFLGMVDVSNPARPAILGHYGLPGWSRRVCVSDDLAYVALGVPALLDVGRMGLCILDIGNPSSPTLRGAYLTTRTVEGVAVANGRAYLAEGYWELGYRQALRILDVADPSSPTLLGSWLRQGGETRDLAVLSPTLVCFTDRYFLRTLDVQDPTSPVVVSEFFLGSQWANTRRLACRGTTVYTIMDWAEVWDYRLWDYSKITALDLSNPAAPSVIDWYIIGGTAGGGRAGDLCLAGDLLVALPEDLKVFDLSQPLWTAIGSYDWTGRTSYTTGGLFMDGDYIYLADAERGLWIFSFREHMASDPHWTLYR
jgi:hypothetical protein